MEERRKYVRIDNALTVSYRIIKGYLTSSAHSRNISEGGICLPIHHKFDPGVVLALKIHILEWDVSIKAVGEIMWIKELKDETFTFWAGIKFIEIPPEGYDKLRRYISKLNQITKPAKIDLL